jgi:hypothetical protein
MMKTEEKVTGAAVWLVTLNRWAGERVPTTVSGKSRRSGVTETTEAGGGGGEGAFTRPQAESRLTERVSRARERMTAGRGLMRWLRV